MVSADSSEDDGLLLTNRVIVVKNNGDRSQPTHVVHGVPQVSVQGPTHLFLAIINDLDSCMDKVYCMLTTQQTLVARGSDPVEAAYHTEQHFGLGKSFGSRPTS